MNLRHIQLILKREYLQRIKSPGFIIGTILGVVGIVALGFLPTLLGLLDQQSTLKVAVVDPRNLVYHYLPENTALEPTVVPGNGLPQSTLPLSSGITFSKADTADQTVLSERVRKEEIDAYVTVEGTRAADVSFVYHGKDRPGATASARLLALLGGAATQAKLEESGITQEQAASLFSTPAFKIEPIVEGSLKDEEAYFQSAALVYILLVLLYTTMLMYGVQVAMGVVEEKSSRVMEMLITAVRPIELMTGKVLGVGLVGLTQYALWVGMGGLLLVASGALGRAASTGAGFDVATVPATTLIFFLVFFVLGYLLYAAIYAALGSLVHRTEDINGITTPVTIIMVATYLLSIWALGNPEADLVKWLSFVPFLTPMLMFIRVALSDPAWWELALSVALLAGTSFLLAWLAAKIYRIGVLLYGKRPSFREIGRLLRAA
ncbi:MAG TPA: ABC transporter permease [Chloroflexia bacterium]|nr:ABC transporter permease [Chloroflexia bacterium]